MRATKITLAVLSLIASTTYAQSPAARQVTRVETNSNVTVVVLNNTSAADWQQQQ
jgi:mitochondrial fission protein ELM1